MTLTKKSAFLALPLLLAASPAFAAGGGVSPYGYELTRVLGFPITNSMVTTWVIAALLIIAIRLMVRRPQLVPGRGQAMVEGLVVGVRDIMEPIIGRRVINHVFPLLITFFLFILIMNWSGLFPGVGTFGHFIPQEQVSAEQVESLVAHGEIVREIDGNFYTGKFNYFFRPANSDMNTTLALALISFAAWFWFVLRYAGIKALAYDIFGNKADKKEVPAPIYFMLFGIFILVGLIEMISIASRPVSLTFRLFGNVFGGENLLTSMHGFATQGWAYYVIPMPFILLELLIGLVQALVFTLLTAVYIGLIVNHGDDEHH